jgi:ribA/ribD-fused uncharacterized protein
MTQSGTAARYGQAPMFSGDLAFLSNFDPTRFHVPALGCDVATAEHAFNALKTVVSSERARVLAAGTPSEAKRLGRRVTLRDGWDTGVRVQAMQRVLVAKFAIPDLRVRLQATGDLRLVETNHWHDAFWGRCFCPTHAETPGTNMLGELLMAIRAKHRDEDAFRGVTAPTPHTSQS